VTTKESILRAISELPEDVSIDGILDTVILRMKVERGRRQIADGKALDRQEVRERLARWLA